MTEHKIDPERYRGMSPEDAARAMEEDERRAINEHPAVVAAVQAMEDRKREKEAEERERQEAADRERRREAEVELEEYRRQELQSWTLRGGHEDHFEEIWPELRLQYLRDKAGPSHEEKLRQSHPSSRF